MKSYSVILFSLAVGFIMIGMHRVVVTRDFLSNYWIFMLSFVCLMLYRYFNRPVK